MRSLSHDGLTVIVVGLLFAPSLLAGQLPATTIDFAPKVTTELQRYGEDEGATLRSAILAALSREAARTTIPEGLAVAVMVQDIAPSHPTRKQVGDDPTVDVTRTRYRGGAELTGYVRDAHQHLVATVTYRHFSPTLSLGSASLDPWADARLAIDQFAAKLAATCRDLARNGKSGS